MRHVRYRRGDWRAHTIDIKNGESSWNSRAVHAKPCGQWVKRSASCEDGALLRSHLAAAAAGSLLSAGCGPPDVSAVGSGVTSNPFF